MLTGLSLFRAASTFYHTSLPATQLWQLLPSPHRPQLLPTATERSPGQAALASLGRLCLHKPSRSFRGELRSETRRSSPEIPFLPSPIRSASLFRRSRHH